MERPEQTVKALGLGACELSLICAGILVLTIMSPKEFAAIAVFAVLYCAGVWFVFGRYARRIGYDNGRAALTAILMWLMRSLRWLTVGRS